MDESAAQTKAILERQRRSFTLEGVLERATAEAVQRLHHNAQRLLRPLAVVNPYVEQLTYPSDRLMHRREQKKYLALINAIALLHQHQREVKRAARGDVELEYVEVTIEDPPWPMNWPRTSYHVDSMSWLRRCAGFMTSCASCACSGPRK